MTGVYTTNTTEAVAYQLKHSRANIAVVDSEAQLQKVLAVRDKLPDLRHSGFSAFNHDNLPKNVYTLKHSSFYLFFAVFSCISCSCRFCPI